MKINDCEKINKYLDLAGDLKKQTVKHVSDGDTNCSWCTWNGHERPGKRTRRTGNPRKNKTI